MEWYVKILIGLGILAIGYILKVKQDDMRVRIEDGIRVTDSLTAVLRSRIDTLNAYGPAMPDTMKVDSTKVDSVKVDSTKGDSDADLE